MRSRSFVRLLPALAAGLLLGGVAVSQQRPPPLPRPTFEGKPAHAVLEVADGLTVSARVEGRPLTLRLAGVSLPEPAAAREQAARFLANLLRGEEVYVEYPGGGTPPPAPPRSGEGGEAGLASNGGQGEPRAAYLFRAPDGLFVNLEAVRQGYAEAAAAATHPHGELFAFYAGRAREARKGFWAEAQPPPPPGGQGTVYVTRTGERYHRQGCQFLAQSSIPLPLAEARQRYTPCAVCRPPD